MIKEQHNPLTDELTALDAQVKPSSDPLPHSGAQSWLICGKKGTGKSTLILSTLCSPKSPWYAKNSFDSLYLCSQSAMKDPKFEDMVKELTLDNRFFDTFNESILSHILDEIDVYNKQYEDDVKEFKMNENKDGKGYYTRITGKTREGKPIFKKVYEPRLLPRHLLILDDCINLLPKSTQTSKINDLYCNQRHKKLCVITVSQVYNKLNPIIRRNADMLSVFHTDNKKEYEAIENDLSVDTNEFKQLYDYATNKMNSFLHVQLCGARPLYFKKFNPICLS